jgi:hypothetical protein
MGDVPLALYLTLKVAAYVLWCFLGAWVVFRGASTPGRAAVHGFVLGTLRLGLGLSLGIVIWFASTMAYASVGDVPARTSIAYLSVYVPIRWLEWAVIAFFLTPGARTFRGFVLGSSPRDRLWRLGGIALSCAADIPMILAVGGLPLGRFMC